MASLKVGEAALSLKAETLLKGQDPGLQTPL